MFWRSNRFVVFYSPSLFQEEQNRGKPNWEHLNEDLHVLLTVEDTQSRAEIKMRRAVDEVKKLLVPAVSTATKRPSLKITTAPHMARAPSCPVSFLFTLTHRPHS